MLDKGGDALASNADLQDAREKVGGQPGFMFVEMQNLLRVRRRAAPARALGPQELSTINNLFKRFRAIGVGIGADAQAIRMNLTSIGGAAAPGNGPGSSLPLDKAPGDAWLAFDAERRRQVDPGRARLPGRTRQRGRPDHAQFETATGLNVKEDLLSWMGDAAFFVEGDSVPSLGGALVVAVDRSGEDARGDHQDQAALRRRSAAASSAPRPRARRRASAWTSATGARKPLLVGLPTRAS